MSAEDIRTSSDSEDEAIQDAINDDDEDIRYSLRSRSVSKAQDASVKTSTGPSGVTVEETRVSVVRTPSVGRLTVFTTVRTPVLADTRASSRMVPPSPINVLTLVSCAFKTLLDLRL